MAYNVDTLECYYEPYSAQQELNFCQKYRCWFIVIISILLIVVLIFILLFIVPPVIFMFSVGVQRDFIFLNTHNDAPSEFTEFKKHGIEGVRNFHVSISKNISIGVWHIVPLEYTYKAVVDADFDYNMSLRSKYPVLLYFHDSGENRMSNKNKYLILRRFFHVIAFDYRCFGDSSKAALFENEIVNDTVELYKWVRLQTTTDVYFWGHTVGGAIASKTIAHLYKDGIVPTGLILESPFTSLTDEIIQHPLASLFTWLPWFKSTIIDPINNNQFLFKTNQYILSVNCPIMILHAKDNEYVSYSFSRELTDIGSRMRDINMNGNVTLHLFSKYLNFGHNNLYQAQELPNYIKNYIEICQLYGKRRG
ncbi:hypothetical protein FQA39_LY12651 [Lamprigera yunnana]|nr:hypothetical protein FQA39_LY12651 [Lamprigera yunnana]